MNRFEIHYPDRVEYCNSYTSFEFSDATLVIDHDKQDVIKNSHGMVGMEVYHKLFPQGRDHTHTLTAPLKFFDHKTGKEL